MKILVFGATGMVGQGVLRTCLAAADVSLVQAVGRSATGVTHSKLRELVLPDLYSYDGAAHTLLAGFDACFFCLGVSSVGMDEASYARVTFDLTLAAARVLAALNSGMTFVYVSGAGTDGGESGRVMWARVKGRTENALRGLGFAQAVAFRPGVIQPVGGDRSKTRLYRVIYRVLGPVLSVVRWMAPGWVLTSETIAVAMLAVARHGAPKAVMESGDIVALARAEPRGD